MMFFLNEHIFFSLNLKRSKFYLQSDLIISPFLSDIGVTSTHQSCSRKKLFLKISQCSQENIYVGVSFWQSFNLIEEGNEQKCFNCEILRSVNIAKFLRITILKNLCKRQLQEVCDTKTDSD